MAANTEKTGKSAASAAGKTLKSKTATAEEKAVAASALSQRGGKGQTSAKVANAAAKTVASKTASKEAKSAAASVLTQKPNKKK
jgi:hypothetical protein